MDVRFQPLTVWPQKSTPAAMRRSRIVFRVEWANTLDLLFRELERLGAKNVVIEIGLRPEDIRRDGWPRAGARVPEHPGVVLSFESRHGPLRYLTDTHADWQHNVRAIALGLEALRAIDRYGVTTSGEQYAGWKALGTGGSDAATPTKRQEAERFLCGVVGEHVGALSFKALYRQALIKAHPDHGGSLEKLEQVRQAGAILGVA